MFDKKLKFVIPYRLEIGHISLLIRFIEHWNRVICPQAPDSTSPSEVVSCGWEVE